MDNLSYDERMELALASLKAQEKPNCSRTALEFNLSKSALSRRSKGETTSRTLANSKYRQCLSNTQEDILVSHIKWLTDRRLPPTSQMVRNMAEEIIGDTVGKNWVSDFVHRRKNVLVAKYLRNIDNSRVKGEFKGRIEEFYQLVSNLNESLL